MRRLGFYMSVFCLSCFVNSPQANAQVGVSADPFSFYFGYYLPHAQYMAAQPTPLDSINRVTANRQARVAADRSALFDPVTPFGEDDLDPLRPFNSKNSGKSRSPRARSVGGNDQHAVRGTGPGGYYNRTSQYFPTLRIGRGSNQNLAVMKGQRGQASMPVAPSGGGISAR